MKNNKCDLCGESTEEMYTLSIKGRLTSNVYRICDSCRLQINNEIANMRNLHNCAISLDELNGLTK